MLRLNELALPPEFALAFCSDAIQPSRVVGGLGSQRKIVPPTKPSAASFGQDSHRIEVCSIGCTDATASNKRIQFYQFQGTQREKKMSNKIVMIAGATCFALLAACDDTSTSSASAELTPAQQACLRDVANTTNNSQVVVLSSAFSEAGTQVTVGVGEDRAPWNCIAYSDGATAGIEFLGDEGAL